MGSTSNLLSLTRYRSLLVNVTHSSSMPISQSIIIGFVRTRTLVIPVTVAVLIPLSYDTLPRMMKTRQRQKSRLRINSMKPVSYLLRIQAPLEAVMLPMFLTISQSLSTVPLSWSTITRTLRRSRYLSCFKFWVERPLLRTYCPKEMFTLFLATVLLKYPYLEGQSAVQ